MSSTTTIQQVTKTGSANGNGEAPVPDKSEVGWLFVQQYYTFLNDQPHRLHLFYTKQSTMCHGVEGEAVPSYYGQSQIIQRIKEHQFNDCKVLISNMDCQESANGGVVVQVLGEMANNGLPSQKFVQTFFLAQQPRGYYVLNDIFRFLKEDVNDDSEVVEALKAPSAVSSAPVAAAAPVNTGPAASSVPANVAPAATTQVSLPKEPASKPSVAKEPHAAPKKTPAAPKETSTVPKETPNQPIKAPTEKASQPNGSTKPEPEPAAASSAPVSWASMAAKKKDSELNGHSTAAQTSHTTEVPASGIEIPAISEKVATTEKAAAPSQGKPTPHTNIIVTTRPGEAAGRRQEYHSAYIRNVSVKVDDALLRKGLEKIGQLTHFQVEKAKNCAFIDFIDAATLKAALAVQELKVGDQTVLIEERKRGGAKNKNSNQRKGGFTNAKNKKT